jgi:hypothetical protein
VVQEPLAAKLEMIAERTGKLLLEPGGVLPGNAMLPTAPGGRGTFAGQKLRTHAQRDKIVTQGALLRVTPSGPFLDPGHTMRREGKGSRPKIYLHRF